MSMGTLTLTDAELIDALADMGYSVPDSALGALTPEERDEVTAFVHNDANEGDVQPPDCIALYRVLTAAPAEAPAEPEQTAEPPADDLATQLDAKNRKLQEIGDAEAAVAIAKTDWNNAKEEAKEARKTYDNAVSHLRHVIRRQDSP